MKQDNLDSVISDEQARIIEQKKQEALNKRIFTKARDIAIYLGKDNEVIYEILNIRERYDYLEVHSDNHQEMWGSEKQFEDKEAGVKITLYRKHKFFSLPAAIVIKYNGDTVFEAHTISYNSRMEPTPDEFKGKEHFVTSLMGICDEYFIPEITGYIPGESWEKKFNELYTKVDSIRQEKEKQEQERKRSDKISEEKKTLRKFGLDL